MTRQERALIVERILHKQYPRPPIPLNHHDNFSFLIAVLLSAQCTDERVNTVTPQLFKTASTPKAMSKLKREKIYKIIKPCGLGPKKSKAIKNLSKILPRGQEASGSFFDRCWCPFRKAFWNPNL